MDGRRPEKIGLAEVELFGCGCQPRVFKKIEISFDERALTAVRQPPIIAPYGRDAYCMRDQES
jgi:hypothetical protein